jgi:hypothetical protein
VEEDCGDHVVRSLDDAGLAPVVVAPHSQDLGHAQVIWDGVAGSDPRADG